MWTETPNWASAKFEAEIRAQAMERVRRQVEGAKVFSNGVVPGNTPPTAAPVPVGQWPSRKRKVAEK